MDAAVSSEALVATPLAARYVTQLCKHFGHRLAVTLDGTKGSIAFPSGVCRLAAEPGLLVLGARSPHESSLSALEAVVARHLERFAFRDKPSIVWRRV